MTPETLEYLLRLTVIWAVLIAYYFAVMRRSGFTTQRFYLLGTLVFGLVIPLLPALGGALPLVNLPSVTYVAEPFHYTGETVVEVADSAWSWSVVFPWLYVAGVVFFLARTLVQWNGLRNWVSSGESDRYDGYRVVRHRAVTGPFVAFGVIFLPAALSSADLERTALLHEAAHLRARHHYDTLLLTIGSLLLWFHPLFWMLRRLLAAVHEYEADAAVIRTVPARTYGLQLLQSSLGPAGYPGLFSSPIKNRITMITTKNPARKLRLIPLFALMLLLAGLVVACSDAGESAATPNYDDQQVQETAHGKIAMVQYGGATNPDETMKALLSDIYGEIRYPRAARNSGTTGTYRANVTIKTDGTLEVIKVFPSTNPLEGGPPAYPEIVVVGYPDEDAAVGAPDDQAILNEIDRTLKTLGKFTPMVKNGKKISSKMNLDFTFKLEE